MVVSIDGASGENWIIVTDCNFKSMQRSQRSDDCICSEEKYVVCFSVFTTFTIDMSPPKGKHCSLEQIQSGGFKAQLGKVGFAILCVSTDFGLFGKCSGVIVFQEAKHGPKSEGNINKN